MMDFIITILAASLLVSPTTLMLNGQATTTSNDPVLTVSQPSALDLYVEQLAFAESSGKEDVIILDSNGKYSMGCLQFQDETFRRFQKKYKISGAIMDCAVQKQLAKLILSNEKTGWKNWTNSVKKIGLPPV